MKRERYLMLRMIELENFKCFGQPARARLAPITLIFGQNSSGKSALLQSLYLLKQTRSKQTRQSGIKQRSLIFNRPRGYVDLGRFEESIYNHEFDSRRLIIRIDVDTELPLFLARLDFQVVAWFQSLHVKTLGLRLQIGKPPNANDIALLGFDVFVDDEPEPMASFFLVDDEPDNNPDSKTDLRQFQLSNVSSSPRYWRHDFEKRHAVAEYYAKAYKDLLNEKGKDDQRTVLYGLYSQFSDRLAAVETVEEFAPCAVDILVDLSEKVDGNEYFLPGRPSLIRGRLGDSFYEDDLLSSEDSLSEKVDEYLPVLFCLDCSPVALGFICASQVDQEVDEFLPLGPSRPEPKRSYEYSGTFPSDVGRHGEDMPEMLLMAPDLLKKVNFWLDQELDVGYLLEMKESTNAQFQLLLRDLQRPGANPVSIADVGYGMSQLLPLIVQSLSGEGRIILVEQPETHIHPALQARLGTLLSESAKERHHQFIIETHSEHLILRLLREIRKGRLSPCDVSVLYVSRGPQGSSIQEIGIDIDGNFLDEWPKGFFAERLREMID